MCWHSGAAGSGGVVPLIGSSLGLGGSQLSGQGLAHGLALTQLGGQAHPEALHHVHHPRHLPRQGPLHDLLLPGQGSLPRLGCTQLSLQYQGGAILMTGACGSTPCISLSLPLEDVSPTWQNDGQARRTGAGSLQARDSRNSKRVLDSMGCHSGPQELVHGSQLLL